MKIEAMAMAIAIAMASIFAAVDIVVVLVDHRVHLFHLVIFPEFCIIYIMEWLYNYNNSPPVLTVGREINPTKV